MTNNNNPWAGLASYEDPSKSVRKLKFCGRDNEIYDVTRLIDDNLLVVLYGKSGVGKTSLLNAGVFPKLRFEQYLPVSIRLGTLEAKASYQDAIITVIEKAIEELHGSITVFNVVEEQTDNQQPDRLWNYFARHRFVNADQQPLFPVVALDQFEEVLRNISPEHVGKAQTLLSQIQYLIDESHALNDCVVDGKEYFYDFNFRFVISIREDELYLLEDSIDDLSLSMFRNCRYRLRSLTEQGARDVVLIPGEGLFVENEQEEIVESIISKVRNKEDHCINSYLLSLVCYRIFNEYTHRNDSHISQSLVDEFVKGNPFEQFYDEATKGLSTREKTYIEDHFVDSTGHRNSIPESDFHKHVPHGKELIEGDNHILQKISSSSGSSIYRLELLHDSFCDHLFERKQKRQQWQKLFRILEIIGVLVIFGLVLFLVYNTYDAEKKNKDLVAQNESLSSQNDSLQAQKNSLQAQNDSLQSKNDSAKDRLESLNRGIKEAKRLLEEAQKQIQENMQKFMEEREAKDHLVKIVKGKNQPTIKLRPITSGTFSSYQSYQNVGFNNQSQNPERIKQIENQIEKENKNNP